jgi:hypothetical protein
MSAQTKVYRPHIYRPSGVTEIKVNEEEKVSVKNTCRKIKGVAYADKACILSPVPLK